MKSTVSVAPGAEAWVAYWEFGWIPVAPTFRGVPASKQWESWLCGYCDTHHKRESCVTSNAFGTTFGYADGNPIDWVPTECSCCGAKTSIAA